MTIARLSVLVWVAGCTSGTVDVDVRGRDAHARFGLEAPDWQAHATRAETFFGESVAAADVNGDGFVDAFVGEMFGGQNNEGRVYGYLGSPSGLETEASWSAELDEPDSWLGYSLAGAGDVNGDGYEDVVVGALLYDEDFAIDGAAFVYLGSALGLEATPAWSASEPDDNDTSVDFASGVASAGDVNGDGFDDVIVGAGSFDGGETDEGAAFVYHGSPAGLDTTAAWSVQSDQDNAYLAYGGVASAGDVNSDGYDDVVVGAALYDNGAGEAGRAFVYLGSANGLDPVAAWTAEPEGIGWNFGNAVAGAGDVNGDGFDDVVVGAPTFPAVDVQNGRVYVYLGSASGPEPKAAWTQESIRSSTQYGGALSGGDVNGDGYADVVVGARNWTRGESREGRVFAYFGSAAGLSALPGWTVESNTISAFFGTSISADRDVNGDGFGDLLVGANAWFPEDGIDTKGAAYLFHGCGDTVDTDGDTIGDACDVCAGSDDRRDRDYDSVPDGCDVCPYVDDPGQRDRNGDGIGDACVPLKLVVNQASVSGGLSLAVGDANAGEAVKVFASPGPAAPSPCPPRRAGLCLALGPDELQTEWKILADAQGRAKLEVPLPPNVAAGDLLTIQAAAARGIGGVVSEPIERLATP